MTALVPRTVALPATASAIVREAGREREVKFVADEASFRAAAELALLGERSPGPAYRRLQTIYFDTQAGHLRDNRIALRMRRVRGGYMMALKWSPSDEAGAFSRGETEVMVRSEVPDIAVFGAETQRNLGRLIGNEPLVPVFATDIRRSTRIVQAGSSTIEVAFDAGFVKCGERREPIREIELELKTGQPIDLYRVSLALVEHVPLTLGMLSKAERGAILATGERPKPVGASAPPIRSETPADEAIAVVLRACLTQFVANWPSFHAGQRVEAVHQMRVALRRLRSALAFFHRSFPSADFQEFRSEARRLASAMGHARNWDVFGDLVTRGPLTAFPREGRLEALVAHARAESERGHAVVADLLAAPATTRFVLAMEAFLCRRPWRNGTASKSLAALAAPVTGLAADCLERLDRRARKLGRTFDEMTPAERHELRIRLKNLRYATGFFGHLFRPVAAVRRFGKRTAALQDLLGHANDSEVSKELVQQVGLDSGPATAYAAGVLAGWLEKAAIDDEQALRAAWRRYIGADRFWRT